MASDNVALFGHVLGYGAAVIGIMVAWANANKAKAAAEAANKIAEKNISASIDLEIAKLREKWINDLRLEVVAFSGCISDEEVSEEIKVKQFAHFNKILLLMNPEDPSFGELEDLMLAMMDRENEVFDPKPHVDFVGLCQVILKREWEKLKSDLRKYGNI